MMLLNGIAKDLGTSTGEVESRLSSFAQSLIDSGVPAADAEAQALVAMSQGFDETSYALDQATIQQGEFDAAINHRLPIIKRKTRNI